MKNRSVVAAGVAKIQVYTKPTMIFVSQVLLKTQVTSETHECSPNVTSTFTYVEYNFIVLAAAVFACLIVS